LNFVTTPLPGAFLVEIDRREDQRGFFARLWCRNEFAAHGVASDMVQASMSHNVIAGTLRGMHFQWPPSREAKLVRCEHGRVHDVIVDLRPESATFMQHFAVTLDGHNRSALYIPPGFAHGFQTLQDNTDVVYMMSDFHRPDLADGVRFDDPAFGIRWPSPITCIADRDRSYPNFEPAVYAGRLARAVERAMGVSSV
jgi:dTDP-4-dehydrorhamnose 3,5-epimerase